MLDDERKRLTRLKVLAAACEDSFRGVKPSLRTLVAFRADSEADVGVGGVVEEGCDSLDEVLGDEESGRRRRGRRSRGVDDRAGDDDAVLLRALVRCEKNEGAGRTARRTALLLK